MMRLSTLVFAAVSGRIGACGQPVFGPELLSRLWCS